MIALLGAMEQEIAVLQRCLVVGSTVREPGCKILECSFQDPATPCANSGARSWKDREIVVARTGIGPQRAEAAARLVCQRYSPRAVVSFGFAGGLSPEIKAADIVVCRRVWRGDGGQDHMPAAYDSDPGLVSLAAHIGAGAVVGEAVTVARAVERRPERERLAATYGAQVVEMESYWVGRAATEKGVPFLTVRIVSDAVKHDLPQFARFLDSRGRVVRGKALRYLGPRPHEVWRLLRLRHNSRRAAWKLGTYLEALLGHLAAE